LDAQAGDHYQFEREGYFTRDSKSTRDSKGSELAFNCTIGLRDNWKA
jgi:glutaminyl-tRNA synthetase